MQFHSSMMMTNQKCFPYSPLFRHLHCCPVFSQCYEHLTSPCWPSTQDVTVTWWANTSTGVAMVRWFTGWPLSVFAGRWLQGIFSRLPIGWGGGGFHGNRCSTFDWLVRSRPFLWAGLGGRGLFGGGRGCELLLYLVSLKEAELNTQFQYGLLFLMDGLIQMSVFILQRNTSKTKIRLMHRIQWVV